MQEAVIIDCLRNRRRQSSLRKHSAQFAAPTIPPPRVIRALLENIPPLGDGVDDVILGCAMPEGEAGNNMARQAALRAGLPDSVSAITINRFCSSGLQAIAMAADRIRSGGADILIAGGSESMSLTPAGGRQPAPNPWFVDHWPEVYMNMGLTAERVQRKYSVSREDADAFALASHQESLAGPAGTGPLRRQIVPVEVETVTPAHRKNHLPPKTKVRGGFHLEALAKLKPVTMPRYRDRGQQFPDQRWSGRRPGHVGREGRAN